MKWILLVIIVSLTGSEPSMLAHQSFATYEECQSKIIRLMVDAPTPSGVKTVYFCVEKEDLLTNEK